MQQRQSDELIAKQANEFIDLGRCKEAIDYGNERVSFWDTLATRESRGQTQEMRYILRPELAKHGNVGLFALADICIDYHENQVLSLRQFDVRRNLIAHHFLTVTYDGIGDSTNERQVGLVELQRQTLEILQLAKHTIIYAVMAVNHAELIKAENRNHDRILEIPYRQAAGLTAEAL